MKESRAAIPKETVEDPCPCVCCRAHQSPEIAAAVLAQFLLLALMAPTQFPTRRPKRRSVGSAPRITASCLNLSVFSSDACLRDPRSSRDDIQIPLIFPLLGSRISPLLRPNPPRDSVKSPSLDQIRKRKETRTEMGTPERAVRTDVEWHLFDASSYLI